MARYFKTGVTSWNSANNWSATSAGGVDNAGVPTAADDVIFELASGNCTIDVTPALCRSLDTTSGVGTYGGTLTHNSATTVTVGDGTAGAGNVAAKLNSGMTYTLSGGSSGSAWSFVSTSGTQQTVDFGGKTTGNLNFTGTGSWLLSSNLTAIGLASTTVTHSAGTLNLNGKTITYGVFQTNGSTTRSLTMGAAALTLGAVGSAWITTLTGLTIDTGTSSITLSGAGATFNSASTATTYYDVSLTGSGAATLSTTASTSFHNLTRTGTAIKTDSLILSTAGTFSVTGTLTWTGQSVTNRLSVVSSTISSTRTVSCSSAPTLTNVDIQEVTAAGAGGTWTGTSLGDCLGNSNITFDTPVTQTWNPGVGGNWSDATKWTSRVPLPQDNVFVQGNANVAMDMPRLGANLDFSTYVGVASSGTNWTGFGSLTLGPSLTWNEIHTFTLSGRSNHTITSAGKQIATTNASLQLLGSIGAVYTLQDAINVAVQLAISDGTFTTNGNNIICGQFIAQSGRTTVLNMGSSAVSLTATGAVAVVGMNSVNTTMNQGTSSWTITTASASARNFIAGGVSIHTFPTVTYTVANSSGALALGSSGHPFGIGTFNVGSTGGAGNTVSFLTNLTITSLNIPSVSPGTITLSGVVTNTIGTLTVNAPNTIQIQNGSVWNISNLALNGSATSTIYLRSTVDNYPYKFNVSKGYSISYVDVRASDASGSVVA